MKRLFWTLLCLILLGIQINQAVFAVSPAMGTSYKGIAGIENSLLEQGVVSESQPVKAPSLISFSGTAALETGKATDKSNPMASAGFVTQSNFFNLDSGNILINPEKDVVINTQEGTLSIGSGAAIFVMESGKDTVIYDLYQARPEQVSVLVNRTEKLVMQPGCMLVLTKEKNKNFEQLAVNCHIISYRRAQEINLPAGTVNAFVANFSIFSALVKIQPLKELVYSKDKRDQQLLEKLLKSAVMLRT